MSEITHNEQPEDKILNQEGVPSEQWPPLPRNDEERKEVHNQAEEEAERAAFENDLGTSRCNSIARIFERSGDLETASEYYLLHAPSMENAKKIFKEQGFKTEKIQEIIERAAGLMDSVADNWSKIAGYPPEDAEIEEEKWHIPNGEQVHRRRLMERKWYRDAAKRIRDFKKELEEEK